MRIKIALRNLIISQIIIITFLFFAYFIWFPHSFTQLGGFYNAALMLIFVDLVLGPLLVFIIYKENKKYLQFDINVLLAIQLAAFIFGAYSLYLTRPAYIVFNNDHFKLVNISYIIPEKIRFDLLKPTFFSKPKMVFIKWPEDMQEQLDIMMSINFFGKNDIDERAEYFEPHQQYIKQLLSKQLNPAHVFNNTALKEKLHQFILKYGGNLSDYAFFPVTGNNKKSLILVLSQKEANPIGIININYPSQ